MAVTCQSGDSNRDHLTPGFRIFPSGLSAHPQLAQGDSRSRSYCFCLQDCVYGSIRTGLLSKANLTDVEERGTVSGEGHSMCQGTRCKRNRLSPGGFEPHMSCSNVLVLYSYTLSHYVASPGCPVYLSPESPRLPLPWHIWPTLSGSLWERRP